MSDATRPYVSPVLGAGLRVPHQVTADQAVVLWRQIDDACAEHVVAIQDKLIELGFPRLASELNDLRTKIGQAMSADLRR